MQGRRTTSAYAHSDRCAQPPVRKQNGGRVYTGLSTGTHVRLEQRVHPSVYLTAELIQLPLLALEARIEAELAENPFLEIAPSAEEPFEREAASDEIDWDSLLAEGHAPMARRSIFEVPEENEREVADRSGDLSAHLEPQLRLAGLPDRELVICLEIIGNLDERGWPVRWRRSPHHSPRARARRNCKLRSARCRGSIPRASGPGISGSAS